MEILNATTLTPSEDKSASVSHDEVLIDYLIENSFLWDKSNSSYRNRALKDSKWNEIADKLHLTAAEAMRRYKTLCERFRRETIKQQTVPNYVSVWTLYDKFARLKDLQMSDFKSQRRTAAAAAAAAVAMMSSIKQEEELTVNGTTNMDFNENNDTTYSDGIDNFDNSDGRLSSDLMVEPEVIGGSTDLSTDSIAAFCQFLEASLKRMPEQTSDELIEEISNLLFRKKRQIHENNTS